MHRFFISEDCFTGVVVVIPRPLVHRLRHVLRMRAGDHIIVLDNSGWEYEVELRMAGAGRLEGVVVNKSPAAGEPQTRITLYQALLKGSKFETVMQKCTEVGVTAFVPLVCERCVAAEPAKNRASRWQRIVIEAAQQSRRGRIPVLYPVTRFKEACKSAAGIAFMPWEGEVERGIGDVLRRSPKAGSAQEVSIFVGPEGGFTASEVEFARGCGIDMVSLGNRILRAETAGLVASAITLYAFCELDGGYKVKGD